MSKIKQGYKQTKVGIIPEDWEVKYIEDIAEVKGGKRLPLGHELTEATTPYPYIRVTNMSMGGLNDKQILYVPSEVQPKIKNYTISKDDLYIAVAGNTLGMVGTIPAKFDGANLTENADKICNIKIHKEFLLFVLMSDLIQNVIQNEITTNAQPKLALTRIKKFRIPFPPLKEQEKIAQILTTWDEAITKQTELLEAKELQKKAIMQKLLSGEVRFSGFSDEWEEARLDKLVFFQEGPGVRNTQYRKSGVKLLNVGNLNNNTLNLSSTETYISEEEAYGAYKHFLIDEGDLLISCSGINSESFKKKIAFAKKEDLPLCMNTSTMRFKNLKNKLLLEYLYFFFQTLFFEKQVFGVLTGSAQFNFGPTHIKWFKIKLPSLPEQQKIAEVLSLADDEINLLKNELQELKQQKKALMQKLLTGQVRVKV